MVRIGHGHRAPHCARGATSCSTRCPGSRCSTPTRISASNDPDGFKQTPRSCSDVLRRPTPRARSCSRCTSSTDTAPPTTAVLAAASQAGGLLVPFCRVNPHDGRGRAKPSARSSAGARGDQAAPARRGVHARSSRGPEDVRAGQRATLPVLIHAGRGIPALGRHAIAARRGVPGRAPDPRPRGRQRPRLDLASGARTARTCCSTPPGGSRPTCWRCSRWSRRDRSCSLTTRPTGTR